MMDEMGQGDITGSLVLHTDRFMGHERDFAEKWIRLRVDLEDLRVLDLALASLASLFDRVERAGTLQPEDREDWQRLYGLRFRILEQLAKSEETRDGQ